MYPDESRHGLSVERLIAESVAFFVLRLHGEPAGCGGIKPSDALRRGQADVRTPAVSRRRVCQAVAEPSGASCPGPGVSLLRLETGIHQNRPSACTFRRTRCLGITSPTRSASAHEKQIREGRDGARRGRGWLSGSGGAGRDQFGGKELPGPRRESSQIGLLPGLHRELEAQEGAAPRFQVDEGRQGSPVGRARPRSGARPRPVAIALPASSGGIAASTSARRTVRAWLAEVQAMGSSAIAPGALRPERERPAGGAHDQLLFPIRWASWTDASKPVQGPGTR